MKSQGFSISGRDLRLNFPEVLSSQATSHKPKQHGYDRSIPIKTFAAAKREKKHTKNVDPQRVSEVKALLSVISLRSTFQQCEALCLQPSGPPESCDKKMFMEEQEGFLWWAVLDLKLDFHFGRICLH